MESLEQINEWLDVIFTYGSFWVYLAIFIACFIENIFPPFPGDTFIVAAGLLAGLGRLDGWLSLAVVTSGGLLSVYIIYLFGYFRGRSFFEKRNFRIYSAEDIVKGEVYFKKYGAFIMIVSRFIVGFRSALTLICGISRYGRWKMLIFSLISYLLFGGLIIYVASTTVKNYELLLEYFAAYKMIVIPLLLIILIYYILRKIVAMRKSQS